jgi:hypothetical protein
VSGFSARLTPSELEAVKSNLDLNHHLATRYIRMHRPFIHLMVGFEFVVQSNLK